ncbi:MAG: 2-dehydropantoate 2-reductase, partial [Thermodesulfobacteriota bacterium]|nr:2-dehydropantoate 2-reductase [Thermodesulfobacteriota bacterium]
GYYGGKLALKYASSDNHQIFFIARGEHLDKIRNDGLKLITTEGDFTATPSLATDNPKELGPLDLILFCVKGYGLENAARMITGNLHSNTVTIPLLNGVDSVERLKAILRQGNILNGCVYISTRIVRPGVIQQTGGSCNLLFGPESGSVEPYKKIETLLKNADIKAELSEDITVGAWSKYLFVGPLAGITSLLEKPFGAIMENKEHRIMLEEMMKEVKSIADAKGIPLPENIIEQSLEVTSNFPYETKSSMQLDFEKGRETELETFTGYIIKSGKASGIKTPLHDKIYSELKNRKG